MGCASSNQIQHPPPCTPVPPGNLSTYPEEYRLAARNKNSNEFGFDVAKRQLTQAVGVGYLKTKSRLQAAGFVIPSEKSLALTAEERNAMNMVYSMMMNSFDTYLNRYHGYGWTKYYDKKGEKFLLLTRQELDAHVGGKYATIELLIEPSRENVLSTVLILLSDTKHPESFVITSDYTDPQRLPDSWYLVG